MTDNRAVGLMIVLVTLPGLAWAWSDYRTGTIRLLLFSRMRSGILADREFNPGRFWAYSVFNALLLVLMMAGGVVLMVKS